MRCTLFQWLAAAAGLASLAGTGCQTTTPGWRVALEWYRPAAVSSQAPVTPVAAQPVGYAVEDVQGYAHYQRSPIRPSYSPSYQLADPCLTSPGVQALPAPTPLRQAPANPCPPGCVPEHGAKPLPTGPANPM